MELEQGGSHQGDRRSARGLRRQMCSEAPPPPYPTPHIRLPIDTKSILGWDATDTDEVEA